jgi:nucleotide-binding universal stress UspA family protein
MAADEQARKERFMALWKQILVGVDGSPASRKALEWASDEAVRHGSELVLLTAYLALPPPLGFGTVSVHEVQSASEAASKAAEQLLMETIRDVLGEDPPVLVHPRVKEGNAAKLLIDLSEDADVVVVGSRGYGGFAGLLLGSVSQNVAAHAKCTVVVAR